MSYFFWNKTEEYGNFEKMQKVREITEEEKKILKSGIGSILWKVMFWLKESVQICILMAPGNITSLSEYKDFYDEEMVDAL